MDKAYAVIEAWDRTKYSGGFADYTDMRHSFGRYNWESEDEDDDKRLVMPDNFPANEDILLASYDNEDYSGSAFVLFLRDGKLFEVNGSHCSCNGLEECWHPEETSWEALKMRDFEFSPVSRYPEAQERLELLFRHFAND